MTRIGSLCSGYGGLEMGLIAAVGGSVAWHVEYDKHPSAVLEARFPGVPNYGDVTTTDWTQVEPVDWLTAGYPCQPFSHAGKRKGKDDERHLWPFVAGAVGVLRPRRVLLENVRGHVSLGLADVLADLSGLGYDAQWGVVRAADAGAPHSRARIFIVAADRHGATAGRSAVADADCQRHERGGRARGRWGRPADDREPVAHADDTDGRRGDPQRCQVRRVAAPGSGTSSSSGHIAWGEYEPAIRRWEHISGRGAPRPTEAGRSGERLSPRFVEWLMGLPTGWVTDVPIGRGPQLKALGNGVVPQQAALAVRMLLGVEAVAA